MHPLPHSYSVRAQGDQKSLIRLQSESLPELVSSAPPEFDGPSGNWSPETLLVAALADCYLLTFRALATKAGLAWNNLTAEAEGTLEKGTAGLAFTAFSLHARLELGPDADREQAESLLHKAEKYCLISASLKAPVKLTCEIA